MTWAVLPLKNFNKAKSRLATVLSCRERAGLFRAMVEDVLSAVTTHFKLAQVWVVSDDTEAQHLAARWGVNCLTEATLGVTGLNRVLNAAAGVLAAKGAKQLLVVHGDLPLIDHAAINQVLNAGQKLGERGLVIATDNAGLGSNCVWLSPPKGISFAYGAQSCQKHRATASRKGIPDYVLRSPALAQDIDSPADLHQLLARVRPGQALFTMAYLQQQGLMERLLSMHEAVPGTDVSPVENRVALQ